MRLNEQRDTLERGINQARVYAEMLKRRVSLKTLMPYGDGSRSDMVNANSDVLPGVRAIIATLELALEIADREVREVRVNDSGDCDIISSPFAGVE